MGFWLLDQGGLIDSSLPSWARGTWAHGVMAAEANVLLGEVLARPVSLWQWPLVLPPMWDREVG